MDRFPILLKMGAALSLALGMVLAPPIARADLLDEEEDAEIKVEPKPSATPTPPAEIPAAPAPAPAAPPVPREPAGAADKTAPQEPKASSKSEPALALPPKSLQTGKKSGKSSSGNEPVHFESRGLKGLRDAGTLELMQNVVVTQGDLRIEADRARVFFDSGKKDVQRIIADGNVKIFKIDEDSGEKIKAFGDKVIFENKERTVVLEGNARLWRGADLVRGSKITYEMASGWIRADRVAGEVYPDSAKGNK